MIKKSITITQQQAAWIEARIASGDYASDSEVVREALREKQHRAAEIDRIRAALIQGEASGFSEAGKEDIRRAVKDALARDEAL
ncbi:MAG: type II toxin-antitoxin system ParD family antitoxin [Alphaproteobacteria bacterium]|nr:type II toxin-antitoxin system ParD family antitoxin [Alphaproteobacteria bacterium]